MNDAKKRLNISCLPQWFLNLIDHKKEFIELADQINWYPAHMKSRYINWVENIGWDWCFRVSAFMAFHFPYGIATNVIRLFRQPLNQLAYRSTRNSLYRHVPSARALILFLILM